MAENMRGKIFKNYDAGVDFVEQFVERLNTVLEQFQYFVCY